MKTKIIILGVLLTLIPAVANARGHKPKMYHYTITHHHSTHIKPPRWLKLKSKVLKNVSGT
jgi:L-asparaginase/Glu-tRNA(Gln) amidotransferase subunit D